jgi:lipopolysaccharide/colanic/teichoic acid biosynthesis glycosyltransferase
MIALSEAAGGEGRRFYYLMKRVLDVILSSLTMLAVFPLGCACALAVLLTSRGPVFFKAQRLGKGGRPFWLYKFRSMVVGAPDWRNSDGSAFTSDRDPRVTPVGRFLRHTSLDELPQLWNVLRGDMSLVGPRPDQVDQIRYYTEAEKVKLAVKPGITGLAQISGRNAIAWEARKVWDAEYVKRQSFLLDLVILCKTIPYILKREGVNSPAATNQEV